MVPSPLGVAVAAERRRDLLGEAAARRLSARPSAPSRTLRQRLGLGLIATGLRLVNPTEALEATNYAGSPP